MTAWPACLFAETGHRCASTAATCRSGPVTASAVFAVGRERDHVAPWRSTYKINLQAETEVTYLLTTGGHNAGIVSEPGHAGRSFRISTRKTNQRYLDPERFLAEAPRQDGSWWPQWAAWLSDRSGALTTLPPMGAAQAGYPPLGDTPGAYVLVQ